jgi:hypothetical protein
MRPQTQNAKKKIGRIFWLGVGEVETFCSDLRTALAQHEADLEASFHTVNSRLRLAAVWQAALL